MLSRILQSSHTIVRTLTLTALLAAGAAAQSAEDRSDELFSRALDTLMAGDVGQATVQLMAMSPDPAADYVLGIIHVHGLLGEPDIESARSYFESSAKGRCSSAMKELSRIDFEGLDGTKDKRSAFQWLERAAFMGDVNCQFLVAAFYKNGEGVDADDGMALAWARVAAESGHEVAAGKVRELEATLSAEDVEAVKSRVEQINAKIEQETSVGGILDISLAIDDLLAAKSGDLAETNDAGDPIDVAFQAYQAERYPEAWRLFLPLAEQGNGAAQFYVARMLQHGLGVVADPVKAAYWYLESANNGVSTACFNLAFMLGKGEGVRADAQAATDLFLRAAILGESDAALHVGFAYGTGNGRRLDLVEAYAWYRLATLEGDETAIDNLSVIEPEMSRAMVAAGRERFEALRRMLDDGTFPENQVPTVPQIFASERGGLAGSGRPDVQDPIAALRDRASRGDVAAQLQLGKLHLSGEGVRRNPALAVDLFHDAALSGEKDAMVELGVLFARGEGTAVDYALAWAWLALAERHGHAEAAGFRANLERVMSSNDLSIARSRLAEVQGRVQNLGRNPNPVGLRR